MSPLTTWSSPPTTERASPTAIPTKQCLWRIKKKLKIKNHWKYQVCKSAFAKQIRLPTFLVLEPPLSKYWYALWQPTLLQREQTPTRLKVGQLIHRKQAPVNSKRKVNTNTIKARIEEDSWMPIHLGNEDAWFTLHSVTSFEMCREVVTAIYRGTCFIVQEKGGLYLEATAYLGKDTF